MRRGLIADGEQAAKKNIQKAREKQISHGN